MNGLLLILLVLVPHIFRAHGYYYWKDYYNKIPSDAFVAGQDVNKENIYIGQGYIKKDGVQGIFPTIILRGQDVYVAVVGARKVDNFVQILCSTDPENIEWIPANSTHLHVLETKNELIRGGVENTSWLKREGTAWLNIGRVKFQGGRAIGKVVSYNVGSADMWFVHNGNEIKATSYEVLTYNDISSKISIPTDSQIVHILDEKMRNNNVKSKNSSLV